MDCGLLVDDCLVLLNYALRRSALLLLLLGLDLFFVVEAAQEAGIGVLLLPIIFLRICVRFLLLFLRSI